MKRTVKIKSLEECLKIDYKLDHFYHDVFENKYAGKTVEVYPYHKQSTFDNCPWKHLYRVGGQELYHDTIPREFCNIIEE